MFKGSNWEEGSLLWRDLLSLGYSPQSEEDWFSNFINCKIGNGNKERFWKTNWIGYIPIVIQFHAVYEILAKQEAKVSDMGE